MATFDDLVVQASLTGGALCSFSPSVTEGKSWEWTIDAFSDDDGEVDMTGVLAECVVTSEVDGVVIANGTLSAVGNAWRLTFPPGGTVNLGGDGTLPRHCPWRLTLTNGAGRVVDVWGIQHSTLIINQGE